MPKDKLEDNSTIPFVDIGANVGWFTLTVAGWGFEVHSFEPMPFNNELLAMSFEANDDEMTRRINHHSVGLDNTARECVILSNRDNVLDGFTICGTPQEIQQAKQSRARQVTFL